MSDTPRTDAAAHACFESNKSDYGAYAGMLNHARQLERELSATKSRIAELESENKRLRGISEKYTELLMQLTAKIPDESSSMVIAEMTRNNPP